MKNEMRTEQPDIETCAVHACFMLVCMKMYLMEKFQQNVHFKFLTKLSHQNFAPHGEVSV